MLIYIPNEQAKGNSVKEKCFEMAWEKILGRNQTQKGTQSLLGIT